MLNRPNKAQKSKSKDPERQKVLKSIDQFLIDKAKHDELRSSIKSRKSIRALPVVAEIYAPVERRSSIKRRTSLRQAISMININEKVKNHL